MPYARGEFRGFFIGGEAQGRCGVVAGWLAGLALHTMPPSHGRTLTSCVDIVCELVFSVPCRGVLTFDRESVDPSRVGVEVDTSTRSTVVAGGAKTVQGVVVRSEVAARPPAGSAATTTVPAPAPAPAPAGRPLTFDEVAKQRTLMSTMGGYTYVYRAWHCVFIASIKGSRLVHGEITALPSPSRRLYNLLDCDHEVNLTRNGCILCMVLRGQVHEAV
jgi:hypothetical protein